MKKSLILSLLIFSFVALPALALETGIEYGTITGLGTKDIRQSAMQIISTLLGFLGVIAIVVNLWGGFKWLTSAGNEEKILEAKKIIAAGIIGLIIIFSSYAIAAFIIEQLIIATGAI